MEKPYYEFFREPLDSGFRVTYVTAPGGYHPPHWHDELEILYHLNGESDITIDGKIYRLKKKHMMVIDSRQIHSTYNYDQTSMFICIHISKAYMEKHVPGIELARIRCTPDDVHDANFQDYFGTCMLLQDLVEAYMREPVTLSMETEGYVLLIFSRLIQHFSSRHEPMPENVDVLAAERLRAIIKYVGVHFREPIRLQDVSEETGLSKEYFCRFFKKNMGMSFLQYVQEVRAVHVYQDLERTDMPISEIMEKNGFTSQKLFNQTFRRIYGCTPSSVRKPSPA